MKSDQSAVSDSTVIFKYADDTMLLVPEHTDVNIDIEFNHIRHWAVLNKLILYLDKTKEIVFRRPRVQHFQLPPRVEDTEQLDCNTLLGVTFKSNLKVDSHVQYLLAQCSQRLYLLKLLHHQGMPVCCSSVSHCCMCYYCVVSLICSSVLGRLPVYTLDK